MKILKFIFILIAIIFVSSAIIYYIYTNNYNLEKIILDLKKNHDVTVLLHKDPKWSFAPKLSLDFDAKINDKKQNFNSENMKFMFSKSYNLSPINLNIESKSLNLRGLIAHIKYYYVFGGICV